MFVPFRLQYICHSEWLKSKHTSIIRIATENRDESFPGSQSRHEPAYNKAAAATITITITTTTPPLSPPCFVVHFILICINYVSSSSYSIKWLHISLLHYTFGWNLMWGLLMLLLVRGSSFAFRFYSCSFTISKSFQMRARQKHFHLIWFQDHFVLFWDFIGSIFVATGAHERAHSQKSNGSISDCENERVDEWAKKKSALHRFWLVAI